MGTFIPAQEGPSNLWDRVFRQVEASPVGGQHFKHGLFPHWVFETTQGTAFRIRRHLAIFEGSRDHRHYERLKKYLYYYRLAFGQARQQDLLDKLVDRPDEAHLHRHLQECMLNLSPFADDYPWKKAVEHAKELVSMPDRLMELIAQARSLFTVRIGELREVAFEIEALEDAALQVAAKRRVPGANDIKVIAALVYLVNPYDRRYDGVVGVGLQDDIEVLKKSASVLRKEDAQPSLPVMRSVS